jgi:parvulin-like peptidyl-prolyl isomerase
MLAQLQQEGAKADISALGDAFLQNASLDEISAGDVAKQFGDMFAAGLKECKTGLWHGPIESSYGVHLVLVTERKEGRMPALAEVRDAVRLEWIDAQRREANEKFFQTLRERYSIVIEQPEPDKGSKIAEVRR